MELLKESIPPGPWATFFKMRPSSLIRKLSIVHDPEAKERVIAILDYWSQTALKPLHESLFKILREIPGDCTFNQGNFTHWLPSVGPYYSMDLSSATDRFPVSLQRAVLEELESKEVADAWQQIMVGESFSFRGTSVTYATGQPMGAYSSWAMFAFTHHLLVRVAAVRSGLPPTWHDYALLGDDIVLTNPLVAQNYRALMDELGVNISEAKTHVSEDTYEFAKRWIRRGEEITGAPLRGLLEKKYYLLIEELRALELRWLPPVSAMVIPGLAQLFTILQVPVRASKAVKFLDLPRREDSPEVGYERALRLLASDFGSYLGCSRQVSFYMGFTMQTIAEVKTQMLEVGLKKCAQKGAPFIRKVTELATSLGVGDQVVLVQIPPVEVIRNNLMSLQGEFDRLRSAYWDNDEDIVFGRVTHVGLDPERVLQTRSSHLILQSNAALRNKYSQWAREYIALREEALASSGEADQPLSNEDDDQSSSG
jgi:hypothetical protein